MSILTKIIQEMYVDPELVAELDDDQKQILFCKIREEQVRRYMVYDGQATENCTTRPQNTRRIRWLMDKENRVWVWLMGEHATDKSIEHILDEETKEKAKVLAETEAETMRLKEEEELKQRLRDEHLEIETENRLRQQFQNAFTMNMNNVKAASDAVNKENHTDNQVIMRNLQTSSVRTEEDKTKRMSEIYQSLVDARQQLQKQTEADAEEERQYWEAQEKKCKESEMQIQLMAKNAREIHSKLRKMCLNSLQRKSKPNSANNSVAIALQDEKSKPHTRSAVKRWFSSGELVRGAGLLPGTKRMASWMHGILSRQQADQLLAGKPHGAYLIRLTCRVFGYALSLKCDRSDKPTRHFIIKRTGTGYQMMGHEQLEHESLWHLVTYHQTIPITVQGNELLTESVGQVTSPPDYQELLEFSA